MVRWFEVWRNTEVGRMRIESWRRRAKIMKCCVVGTGMPVRISMLIPTIFCWDIFLKLAVKGAVMKKVFFVLSIAVCAMSFFAGWGKAGTVAGTDPYIMLRYGNTLSSSSNPTGVSNNTTGSYVSTDVNRKNENFALLIGLSEMDDSCAPKVQRWSIRSHWNNLKMCYT